MECQIDREVVTEFAIKFYERGYRIERDAINVGFRIIGTKDDKYILVNYSSDIDTVEILNDKKELLKKLKEYYGADVLEIPGLKEELGGEE